MKDRRRKSEIRSNEQNEFVSSETLPFFPFKLHGTHFCCKSTYRGKSNVHFHHDLHSGQADNALSDQQMLCVID